MPFLLPSVVEHRVKGGPVILDPDQVNRAMLAVLGAADALDDHP